MNSNKFLVLVFCILIGSFAVLAEDFNLTAVNSTDNNSSVLNVLDNSSVLINDSSNNLANNSLTNNSIANVSVKVPIVCSATQCDSNCSVCSDKSCQMPDVGCKEELSIEKITPVIFTKGLQQVNILVKNTGNVALPLIDADVSGYGVLTNEKISIANLIPGDKDYAFTKINITESGKFDVVVKVYSNNSLKSQKIMSIDVSEDKVQETIINSDFNSTIANEELANATAVYNDLEKTFYAKQKGGYILYSAGDDLKGIKENLRLAQVAVIEQNQKEFDKNMAIVKTSMGPVAVQLNSAEQEKKTLWQTISSNIPIIGACLGVIISITTILTITKFNSKVAKAVNVVKEKKIFNKNKKTEEVSEVKKETTESPPQ